MTIEILFSEVCGLNGDKQNADYLRKSLPEAEIIETPLCGEPYFADSVPDMIYIGSMSEKTQRKVIEKLKPLKNRIEELVELGVIILATGNAADIFAEHISFVTENIEQDALGIFNLTVKTDLFARYNGKSLVETENIKIVGFRSQFSFLYGDNSDFYFAKCIRGVGINKNSVFEGMRKKNLICTQLLGPILPLNPFFCEYLFSLMGENKKPAFYDAALDAYNKRLEEFSDKKTLF